MLASAFAPLVRSSLARSAVASTSRRVVIARSFHPSSSSLKKGRGSAREDDLVDEDADEADEDDLFSTSSPTSAASTTASSTAQTGSGGFNAARASDRSQLVAQLTELVNKPAYERRHIFAHTRVGVLRRIVQMSQTAAELEGLGPVLKGWRVLGGRVTRKTGDEIVGRCIHLGRPDIAVRLLNDPLQYGVAQPTNHTLALLYHSLLVASAKPAPSTDDTPAAAPANLPIVPQIGSISPTLALLRLSLLLTQSPSSRPPKAELASMLGRLRPNTEKEEGSKRFSTWREKSAERLEGAGGAWKEAVDEVMKRADGGRGLVES